MKVNCKLLTYAIKLTAVVAIINHHLKLIIKNHKSKAAAYELSYNYRFGRVNYIKRGNGPAALLLHNPAIDGSKSEWEAVISSLSRNCTVFATDLPGFGNSAQPDMPYSSYLYASFINDFIENVIGEPALVIASGKSADFALCAASFTVENFKKLVMVSPTGFREIPQKCHYSSAIKYLIELPLYGTFIYNLFWIGFLIVNLLPLRRLSINNHRFNYSRLSLSDQASKFAVFALYCGDLNIDIRNVSKKLTLPMLIVLSSTDSIKGIPCEIETLMFKDAEYMPHLCDTNKFIKEVLSWLKK